MNFAVIIFFICYIQAIFTGWLELIENMVDSNEEGLQPINDNRKEYYAFVVAFVFVGGFFSLNMFVAVAVDTFKKSQKHVSICPYQFHTPLMKFFYFNNFQQVTQLKDSKITKRSNC